MAPRRLTKATLPPPLTSDRDKSPELGSPSKKIQYNKQTGRPVRQSAGKVRRAAGYVDSSIIIGAEEGALDADTTDTTETTDESDLDMPTPLRKRRTTQAKRKRSPSPPSPTLQPIIYNQEVDDMTDDEAKQDKTKEPPVTLQFIVPLGFHGPLSVKLDSTILKNNEENVRHEMQRPRKKKSRTEATSKELPAPSSHRRCTFTDLPPELRNKIYRHLFVRQQKLTIPQRSNMDGLSLSAQFLRVCKTAYNEGCSILYGENTFQFDRHHDVRAPFWDSSPKEIGYQDFLHFLKMIGPENLQYLRDLVIEFEDALPKNTHGVESSARRYPGDPYLLNCLRILRNARLRDVVLKFYGRRQLWKGDARFLGYLEQIKVDSVTNGNVTWVQKMPNHVWVDVKAQMVRKSKLYEKKEKLQDVSSP